MAKWKIIISLGIIGMLMAIGGIFMLSKAYKESPLYVLRSIENDEVVYSDAEPFQIAEQESEMQLKSSIVAVIEDSKTIQIINQSYIDLYLNWDFKNIDNSTWTANFRFDEDIYEEIKSCLPKASSNVCWTNIIQKYFQGYSKQKVIADIKNLTKYPLKSLSNDISFSRFNIDLTNGNGSFLISFPNGFKEGLLSEFGFGSTVVNTTTGLPSSSGEENDNKRIFYDQVNNRWHIIYIDNLGDIHTSSSGDNGITWEEGTIISAISNNYAYSNFDCTLIYNTTNSSLHCVYADSVIPNNFISYKRCELSDTITCGTEEVIFNSSDQGRQIYDDALYPRITADLNNCLLLSLILDDTNLENPSDTILVLTKEANNGTGCGDGDFDSKEDTASGFPIYNIQSGIGYGTSFAQNIRRFDDNSNDAQLYWVNTSTTDLFVLYTAFFNGTSNSVSPQKLADADVEGSTSSSILAMANVLNNKTILFGMDDGTTTVDAYIFNKKNKSLTSQVYTNVNTVAGTHNPLSAVVDTRSPEKDDIWLFLGNSSYGSRGDLIYAKSTDGGDTWSPLTVLVSNQNGTYYANAYFENETCNIGVIWMNNSVTPRKQQFDIINTGSCALADATPPSGNLTTITNNSVYNSTKILIGSKWNETGTVRLYINWTLNQTEIGVLAGVNFTFITNLTNGTYIVNATDTDASNNVGETPFFIFTIANNTGIEAPPTDTCTYSGAGDWNINCADNCIITSPVNMPGNDIHTYGTGSLEIRELIDARNVFNRCNLFCRKIPSCFG